jgi:hypothetical protein
MPLRRYAGFAACAVLLASPMVAPDAQQVFDANKLKLGVTLRANVLAMIPRGYAVDSGSTIMVSIPAEPFTIAIFSFDSTQKLARYNIWRHAGNPDNPYSFIGNYFDALSSLRADSSGSCNVAGGGQGGTDVLCNKHLVQMVWGDPSSTKPMYRSPTVSDNWWTEYKTPAAAGGTTVSRSRYRWIDATQFALGSTRQSLITKIGFTGWPNSGYVLDTAGTDTIRVSTTNGAVYLKFGFSRGGISLVEQTHVPYDATDARSTHRTADSVMTFLNVENPCKIVLLKRSAPEGDQVHVKCGTHSVGFAKGKESAGVPFRIIETWQAPPTSD